MNARTLPLAAALACLLPLAACNKPAPPAAPASADPAKSFIGRQVEKAVAEARRELATRNISISDGVDIEINGRKLRGSRGLPKAEISPQGDLLIEGKAVAITAEQRKELLAYRGHIITIAEAGMGIGVEAAELASKAVGEAIGAVFNGGDDKGIEERIEAEAGKIKAHATEICAQLPPLLESQQKLAASLPEFKPYANMTLDDIDDCKDEIARDGKSVVVTDSDRERIRQEIREDLRDDIRSAVREAIRDSVRGSAKSIASDANDDQGEASTATR